MSARTANAAAGAAITRSARCQQLLLASSKGRRASSAIIAGSRGIASLADNRSQEHQQQQHYRQCQKQRLPMVGHATDQRPPCRSRRDALYPLHHHHLNQHRRYRLYQGDAAASNLSSHPLAKSASPPSTPSSLLLCRQVARSSPLLSSTVSSSSSSSSPSLAWPRPASLNPILSTARHSSSSSSSSSKTNKMSGSTTLRDALASNEKWAAATASRDPTFFSESAKGQQPKILWLGCSDSRVPESTILGVPPGAVFTHRNIANVFHGAATDLSSLAVIEYAVAAVGVQHVVVCGHTSCGGVAAALANRKIGVIDAWLAPLRAARARLARAGTLHPGLSDADRSLALVEENVREGVRALRANPNVIAAAAGRNLTVHGLVYDLASGRLRELDVPDDEADAQARRDACTVE